MKKTYLLILAAAISVTAFASPSSDSLRSCVHKVQIMTGAIENLQRENKSLRSEMATMNTIIVSQKTEIDSLKSNLTNTSHNVVALADSLNINITTTQQQIQSSSKALNETISSKSLWKNRGRLGQRTGGRWDTFDVAKLTIFSQTVAF